MAIVVTGGAGRIGSAIVQSLCEQGQTVILQFHTSENQARQLQSKWPDLVSLYECNLLQEEQLQSFLEFLDSQVVSGLINNAALFERNPLDAEWSLEIEQRQIQLNTLVPLRLCQRLRPSLQNQQGAIVNVVDNVSGLKPWPNHAGYAASKAGLLAITRSLAVEFAPFIRVNAVGPGMVLDGALDSPEWQKLCAKIPMQRWGEPKEVAETIVFLLLRGTYITGQILCVDGGWNIAS
jgi:pteridine reductase